MHAPQHTCAAGAMRVLLLQAHTWTPLLLLLDQAAFTAAQTPAAREGAHTYNTCTPACEALLLLVACAQHQLQVKPVHAEQPQGEATHNARNRNDSHHGDCAGVPQQQGGTASTLAQHSRGCMHG